MSFAMMSKSRLNFQLTLGPKRIWLQHQFQVISNGTSWVVSKSNLPFPVVNHRGGEEVGQAVKMLESYLISLEKAQQFLWFIIFLFLPYIGEKREIIQENKTSTNRNIFVVMLRYEQPHLWAKPYFSKPKCKCEDEV